MNYQAQPEVVLCGLGDTSVEIPEMNVTYTRASGKMFEGSIRKAPDVADFIKSTFGREEIELQEQFIVLYLNQKHDVIGYYRHSRGGINSTVADIRIILGAALKSAAVGLVVAHNHPSGNLTPSGTDKELTAKLKEGAQLVDLKLYDHLILTKNSYFSFADEGLLGLDGLASLPAAPKAKEKVPASKPRHSNQHELNQHIEKLLASRGDMQVYSDDEKAILRRYSGSGGQGKHGATGEGVLYEFYTPDWVCD